MTTRLIEINKKNSGNDLSLKRHQDILKTSSRNADTVIDATAALIRYMEGHTSKTQVVNQLTSIGTPDVVEVVDAVEALHATLKTHQNTDLTELTTVMHSILAEAKQIPKAHAEKDEQKFVDYTKQFSALAEAVKAVEKVVKAQELVVHPPVVNVPETNVKVDAPDLKPLQQGFKDVVKAVTKIVIPEYKTDNTAVEKLIKDANKLLKGILEKPVGGGGGGGSSWTATGTNGIPVPLNLNASGQLKTNGLISEAYDSITATYPTTSSEVYTYKLAAVTTSTVTVTYTDATKALISTVVRT